MARVLAIVCFLAIVSLAAAATVSVQVSDNSFSPKSLTIHTGDTVSWVWSTTGVHNVAQCETSQSPTRQVTGFYSGIENVTGNFNVVFPLNGVYHYLCEPHVAAGMRGSITVQTPTPTSASSALLASPLAAAAVIAALPLLFL